MSCVQRAPSPHLGAGFTPVQETAFNVAAIEQVLFFGVGGTAAGPPQHSSVLNPHLVQPVLGEVLGETVQTVGVSQEPGQALSLSQ